MEDQIKYFSELWRLPEIISAILVLGAVIISLLAIRMNVLLKNNASHDVSLKGLFSLTLMIFVSYFLILFVLLLTTHFNPDLITGSMIFLGACFCYMTVSFVKTFLRRFYLEVSRRKRLEEQLQELSIIDHRTGLYNYRGFLSVIEHQLLLAKRNRISIVMCYIDLDNLEKIKEELGHQEAALMVTETARLMKTSFRKSDILARVNESEFMALLVNSGKEHIKAIENNFREKIASYNANRSQKYQLPVNFCIASYDPEFNDMFENIHAQADEFLQELKKENSQGRDSETCSAFPDMQEV